MARQLLKICKCPLCPPLCPENQGVISIVPDAWLKHVAGDLLIRESDQLTGVTATPFPGWSAVHALYHAGGPSGDQVQARQVAQEPFDVIATKTGIAPGSSRFSRKYSSI